MNPSTRKDFIMLLRALSQGWNISVAPQPELSYLIGKGPRFYGPLNLTLKQKKMYFKDPLYLRLTCNYRKLVETFHVVSERQTAVYFCLSLITISAVWTIGHFWCRFLQQLDRLRLTTVNRDRTRQNETFIYTIQPMLHNFSSPRLN